jgi:hypothetical protein
MDIVASHQFLERELRTVLSSVTNHKDDPIKPNLPPLIIGRFGTSESEIMNYATSTVVTSTTTTFNSTQLTTTITTVSAKTETIPSNFYTPGYYFTNETTLAERRATLQQWGWQRIRSYSSMNLFGILDWSQKHDGNTSGKTSTGSNTTYALQMRGIESYAPQSGYIHASTIMYPPCLTIPKIRKDRNITTMDVLKPWTMQLEHKIVLIVHPFIDSIRNNIPKLQSHIWANIRNDHVYGAPYSCFPNVTEFKFIRTPLPRKTYKVSWMESLEEIQREIDAIGYFDIALLGCGGYGLPLMAHISTLPFTPSAIYIGGALQLFFGIHGTRWSVPKRTNPNHPNNTSNDLTQSYYDMWSHVYNDAWIWPLWSDIENTTIGMIENGAYIQPNQAINQVTIQRHKWFEQ